jgi:hypothetical protein
MTQPRHHARGVARRGPALLLAGASCLAGCRPAGEVAPFEVLDSVGVAIRMNRPPDADAALPWRVAAAPSLDIGGGAQGPADELFRAVASLRLRDGGIVVANAGTYELRYFDRAGRLVHTAGREGDGPGEFRDLSAIFRWRGDSILVADSRLGRLTFLDAAGRFGRSLTTETSAEMPFARVVGLFADGTLLAQGGIDAGGRTPSGLLRFPVPFFRLDTAAAPIARLGPFPGNEAYFEAFAEQRAFRVHPALFSRRTQVLAGDTTLYVAPNDTYEIRAHRRDGTLASITRLVVAPRAVTDADVARERDRRLADLDGDERRRTERVLQAMPRPATWPAYGTVALDDSLHLWVSEHPDPEAAARGWRVFDRGGRLLGRLELPAGLEPHHIGHDFVLGRWADDLGVEHIRLYRLERR